MVSRDDAVFKALADSSRRALLDRLRADNGQTLAALCDGMGMARQSVSKHLAVLERANLIAVERRGREKIHYLNADPIAAISERWIRQYEQRRVDALARLKHSLEHTVDTTEFLYVTYIDTTPDRLWEALTNDEFIRQYWGVSLTSDWQVGSTIRWELDGVVMDDPEQRVLEAEPGKRLSYTWHTLTDEFVDKFAGDDPEQFRAAATEPRSTITFDIEETDGLVKLTVRHHGFASGSALLDGVSQGWPGILSSLKTLLETGSPLGV